MTKRKKGEKYYKGLLTGTEETEEHQEGETKKSAEKPNFNTSDNTQSIKEHNDILNQAFFSPKGQDKDK